MFSRSKLLLDELGNPQNTHKVIHVAGTSGKGTVCYMIDAILRAHDMRTALMVSPHVYDIRERIQVNGQYAPEKHFIKVASQVIQIVNEMASEGNAPSYYETITAIGFLLASKKSLNYLVIETGIGGKYDMSNIVETPFKYSVLTQIGLDHQQILGTTYEQIASQKAEIIQYDSKVTALKQRAGVNEVFSIVAERKKASISWVENSQNYQIDDLMLAIDATMNIAKRDGWELDFEKAKFAAENVYIPGRFEKRTLNNQLIILDGAHNPQKLSALAGRIERESLSPVTVVLALGEHKDYQSCLRAIKNICSSLIVCEFFLNDSYRRKAQSSEIIAAAAKDLNFENVQIVKDPITALKLANSYNLPVICTGSFYLLGEIDKVF